MKIVWSWLREFCPTEHSASELAERLTLHGVKVEEVLRPWQGVQGVVVARVVKVEDHPNSQQAHRGHGRRRQRASTWSAPASATTTRATSCRGRGPGPGCPALSEPLAPRDLGGVVSNGMLCSPASSRSPTCTKASCVLNGEPARPGDDVATALGLDDEVLDIEVEPNRPDFLSVLGVAREVAVLTGTPLVDSAVAGRGVRASRRATWRRCTIDALDGCPRYVARVIRGIGGRIDPDPRAGAAHGVRHATDLAGGRRHELRDARARAAAARVRPASPRGARHRRSPRRRGRAAAHARRRRPDHGRGRPVDLRPRAAGRDRRT